MDHAYNLTLINFYPLVVCVLDLKAIIFTELFAGCPTTDPMFAEKTLDLLSIYLASGNILLTRSI